MVHNLTVCFNNSDLIRNLYTRVKKLPLIGAAVRKLARVVVPIGTRVWSRIPTGLGGGLWLHLDTRFELDYATGEYEPLIENAIASSLLPGSVFYDVGAHIGFFSLLAARIVGESGAVFAFEADPDNAERIRQHARRNGLNQIHVVSCAVWSSPEKLTFQRASRNSSRNQGAVAMDPQIRNEDMTEVEAISLDSFSTEHAPPTLIKMDIEGGEIAALQGTEQTLTLHRPALICEVHNQIAEEYVIRLLRSKHYTVTFLEESNTFPRHVSAKST